MKNIVFTLVLLLCVNMAMAQAYLGIYVVEPTSAELRTAGVDYGLKIESVIPGSPAEQSGLREGNIIFKINRTNIRSESDLEKVMSRARPYQVINVNYTQENRQFSRTITLTDREVLHRELYIYNYIQNPWLFIGITVEAITPNLADVLNLETGMLILSVRDMSIASIQGIESGDIIISINDMVTHNEKSLTDALNKGLQNQPIIFKLWRNSQIITLPIDLSNSLQHENTSNEIFIIGPDVFDNELYGYTREQINNILNKPQNEFEADLERLEDEIFKLRQAIEGR